MPERPSGEQKLYTPDDSRPWRILRRRGALVGAIILGAYVFFFLFARDMAPIEGRRGALDSFGYVSQSLLLGEAKDYEATTPWARLGDGLIFAFVKIALLLIVFGAAYEVLAKRFIEWLNMARLKTRLSDHILICGFGPEGQAAARELLAKGVKPAKILPIDPDPEHLMIAAKLELTGLRGDPTHREVLEDAVAMNAKAALICTDRDDSNLLAVLAFRAMNKDAAVVASVLDPNNVRFMERGGADFVLTHATVAGVLMAGSVVSRPVTGALLDLISAEGAMELCERDAREDEIGKRIVEIDDAPAIQILRNGDTIGFWSQDDEHRVQAGDRLVVVRATPPPPPEPAKPKRAPRKAKSPQLTLFDAGDPSGSN